MNDERYLSYIVCMSNNEIRSEYIIRDCQDLVRSLIFRSLLQATDLMLGGSYSPIGEGSVAGKVAQDFDSAHRTGCEDTGNTF